jgi:hypothetical protein
MYHVLSVVRRAVAIPTFLIPAVFYRRNKELSIFVPEELISKWNIIYLSHLKEEGKIGGNDHTALFYNINPN